MLFIRTAIKKKHCVMVMDRVVNIFRRIDDKSEVSYKFGLNRE